MIRAKHTIRHDGITYKKGALIKGLKEDVSKRLVEIKAAEFVVTPDEELNMQLANNTPKFEVSPEIFEDLSRDLNDLYNVDDLKKAAVEVGVNLTGVSKKADIIAAIINQGKANELIEDDEDGKSDDNLVADENGEGNE